MGLKDWAKRVGKEINLQAGDIAVAAAELGDLGGEITFKRENEVMTDRLLEKMEKRAAGKLRRYNKPVGGKIVVFVAEQDAPDALALNHKARSSERITNAQYNQLEAALKLSISQLEKFKTALVKLEAEQSTVKEFKAFVRMNSDAGKSFIDYIDFSKKEIDQRIKFAKEGLAALPQRENVRDGATSQPVKTQQKGTSIELSFDGIKSFWNKKKKK